MAVSNTTDRVKGLLSQAIKAIEQGSTTANKEKYSGPELSKLYPNIYYKKRSNESPDLQPSKYQTRLKPKPIARGEKKTHTVTRKFFCLANKQQEKIPTVQDKRALSLNNLGEKWIALAVNGAHTDLHKALIDNFPKLSLPGCFELMFAELGSKPLQIIPYIEKVMRNNEKYMPYNEKCVPNNKKCVPNKEKCTPNNEKCVPNNKRCTHNNEKWTPANEHVCIMMMAAGLISKFQLILAGTAPHTYGSYLQRSEPQPRPTENQCTPTVNALKTGVNLQSLEIKMAPKC